jgi:hypothetical protein
MQKKELNIFLFAASIFFLSYSQINYAVVTYLPEGVRKCFEHVHEMQGAKISDNTQELCWMIAENRIVADEKVVRNAIREIIDLLKQDNHARDYLNQYLAQLNKRSILLNIEGEDTALTSLPAATLARALKTDATSMDMIYLSSQLTHAGNIELCGNAVIPSDLLQDWPTRARPKAPKTVDPSVIFNPNMLTNITSALPTVTFGTGVSSPVINAWTMTPSTFAQSPINMQFSIPTDLLTGLTVTMELHFLVTKQFLANGNARVRVSGLYTSNSSVISMPVMFTNIVDSNSFPVMEPTNVNDLLHVYTTVNITSPNIQQHDLALISVTRVEPNGIEYTGNIYLVAAAFNYTSL